jgi:hypothetical protein
MRSIRERLSSESASVMRTPMGFVKQIFVGLFGLVAVLFLGITGYVLLLGTSDGAATPKSRRASRSSPPRSCFRRSFTLSDLQDGDWAFACFAGQQVSDLPSLVRPFAEANGFAASPSTAWAGDPEAAERWALVMYAQDGTETILPMNERLVRYRKTETDAAGWCFKDEGHELIITNSRMETVPDTRPAQDLSALDPKLGARGSWRPHPNRNAAMPLGYGASPLAGTAL